MSNVVSEDMPQDKDYTGHIDSYPNQEEGQHIDINDDQQ